MQFCRERLIELRTKMGLTKAEAARMLKVTAMAYGRYESGEREPSYQTVNYMAEQFGTSTQYLYGETSQDEPVSVVVYKDTNPELFEIINQCLLDHESTKRLLEYYKKLDIPENANPQT